MRRGIRERGRSRFVGAAIGTLAVAALAIPSPASAAFHLTKVTEVYAGTGVTGTDDYIELQAYQAGQNQVSGHKVTVYDDEGVESYSYTFPTSVPNAQTQRTILLAAGPLPNGVEADFVDPTLDLFPRKNGGAVCFDSAPVDCVAWGNFVGAPGLPGAVGSPVAPGGLANGSSIVRKINAGCATLLEAGDDTDDSAADFTLTTERTPRPNSEAPTEKSCGGGGGGGGDGPDTKIDKGPKKKTSKSSAKFKFSSSGKGADFECSLDGKKFKACESPLKVKKLKPGKHTLEVRAVVDGTEDDSPARYRWKVLKKD